MLSISDGSSDEKLELLESEVALQSLALARFLQWLSTLLLPLTLGRSERDVIRFLLAYLSAPVKSGILCVPQSR